MIDHSEFTRPTLALTFLLLLAISIYLFRQKLKPTSSERTSPIAEGLLSQLQFAKSVIQFPNDAFRQDSIYEVSKDLDIPGGWFTDAKTFALERRAIFAKNWLCITHISHFHKPGDYLTFNISDYSFFLIFGKDRVLRGFHNVCRHRAYDVTRKPMGSSLVLGCRYHGWSYDTKGKLTKAPHFDNVPGFKKEENSLFQIWVKTDPNGFVFVNFDGDDSVVQPQTQDLDAFAHQSRITSSSSMVAFWQAEGDFNWKLAHSIFEASTRDSIESRNSQRSLLAQLFGRSRNGNTTCQASAISALRSIPGTQLWSMTVVEPLSATRSSLRCTLYSTQASSKVSIDQRIIETIHADFKQKLNQLNQQFSMVKTSSSSATNMINSMNSSQSHLLEQIKEHIKQERKAGMEIFPAAQYVSTKNGASGGCGVAERLCRELDSLADAGAACFGSGSGGLAW